MEWLILGIVVVLTIINVPIGFALSISAIILLMWKGTASISIVPLNLFSGASSFPLLAIPLFILAGGLMETSGISLRLVNLANSMVGFIRGGLAMVTVVATMIQSEISGSSVADAAAIGNVVIPAMEKRGYPRALSAAIVSNAASAAILIPPSIPMIIYAWMAETSVAKLFVAGFLPGFIACGAMMVLSYYYARKYNLPVEQKFARMILETTSNKYLILLFLNIFFFIAGMFLHSAAAIILIVPIVMPLIRQIGVDPIHFGIIVTINLGVGQQTPPVATVLFTVAAIARLPFWEVFKMGWPFTLVLALVTLLVTYVPWISLGVINLIKW